MYKIKISHSWWKFYSCYALKNIIIPQSVISISNYTFYLCINLESVIIGENIETIGKSAFQGWNNLVCIYFYGETPPEFVIDVFLGVTASAVMTLNNYQNETFGSFNVSKGTTISWMSSNANDYIHIIKYIFNYVHWFTSEWRNTRAHNHADVFVHAYVHTHPNYVCFLFNIFKHIICFEHRHIETVIVIYNYTVVVYSFEQSYYISIFTISIQAKHTKTPAQLMP